MIQIDIPMPDTCYTCPFAKKHDVYWKMCMFTRKKATGTKRQHNCPLTEVQNEV